MKKLINDPDDVSSETMEGLTLAFPHLDPRLEGIRALARRDAPIPGKVAVVTGGGSGHEPMWWCYVGPGMPDASIAGNIFAAPPPGPIYQTAKAVDGGRGVLFVYANYSGDVLNFDAAVEMLEADNVAVAVVLTTDDVASRSTRSERRTPRRRGFIFHSQNCGGATEEGVGLQEVAATAKKANSMTRTMAPALSSCTIPASGRPISQIGEDELEIGMGGHGEPGVYHGPHAPCG